MTHAATYCCSFCVWVFCRFPALCQLVSKKSVVDATDAWGLGLEVADITYASIPLVTLAVQWAMQSRCSGLGKEVHVKTEAKTTLGRVIRRKSSEVRKGKCKLPCLDERHQKP